MGAIIVRDLRVQIAIGIHDHERGRLQVVSIDLDIGLPREAIRRDELQYTIDYDQVARRIEALAASRHFGLIETLVDRIAEMLIDELGAPWARVSAAKVGVMLNAQYVGVAIERGSRRSVSETGSLGRLMPDQHRAVP